MAKFKTQINGVEHEVDLGDAFVPKEELTQNYMPKTAFQEELNRRVESIGSKKLEEALNDEKFRQSALDKWGIKIPKEGEQDKAVLDQIAEARRQWEHKDLSPLRKENETYKGEVSSLRDVLLQNQIIQAGIEAGVKKSLLKSPAAGVPAPIVAMLGQVFGYDDKTKQFYVKNGDTFAFTSSPADSNGSPYKGVTEFLREWAGDKGNTDFVEDRRQGGPNLQNNSGDRRPSGPHVISREDARDPQKYRAAREAAVKAGAQLTIGN